jgi:TolA-binding protein
MRADECAGALVLRSRNGALSSRDELLLEAHLAGCESCRVLLGVMSDFDAAATADRHDGMRIQQLVSLARNFTRERQTPAPQVVVASSRLRLPQLRGVPGLLLAAAVFLLVVGASAAMLVQRAVNERGRVAESPLAATELGLPLAEHTRQVALRVRSSVRAEVAPVTAALDSPNDLLGIGHAEVVRASGACASGGCFDVARLFKEANEARRQGRMGAAIADYRELQHRAPGSREAQFSHLSLGNLLLAAGNSSAALSQFDAALRSAAARNVQAEALYGRGLALARLGRAKDEHQNWQRLLDSFGSSPYAAHARRRLGVGD